MSAIPDAVAPYRLHVVSDPPSEYDYGERRPTPGEVAGGERHVRIPVNIFDCPYLSHGAVRLYGRLQQHTGDAGCFPSYETLAGRMGCSERAVKGYRQELEDAGVIVHKRGGGARSNRYELTPDRLRDKRAKSAHIGDKSAKSALESVQKTAAKSAKSAQESNLVNQTSLIKDSAPTERAAPRQRTAPKTAVETPKQPTRTIEAKPEVEQVPRAKRASDAPPKPNKFGDVIDAIRALGVEPIYNRGRDAKAVNECSEPAGDIAAAYVGVRRGEWGSQWLKDHPHIYAVCADMAAYRAWQEAKANGASDAKASAAGGPDQAGRPGRAPGVQGAPGGTAGAPGVGIEEHVRNQREQWRRLVASKEGGTVPRVPVPDARDAARLAQDGTAGLRRGPGDDRG